MGKQQTILESRLIDPMNVSCSSLDEIQLELVSFKAAKSDFKPKPEVPRLTIRSLTDRAVLGHLLLRARALHRLDKPLSNNKDLDNGEGVQKRGANGKFIDNPDSGFCRWLKEALPSVSRSSANNYMHMAENVGLSIDKQPNFVLAPSVKSYLHLPQHKLYMKPTDFKDMLRKESPDRWREPDKHPVAFLFL